MKAKREKQEVKILKIKDTSADGKFHFARFEDRSFLSVEPKGDNKIYVMCWSTMDYAIAYATIANLPEDVGIVSIHISQMPDEMIDWPDDQLLMLDRDLEGKAKIISAREIKRGQFVFTDYQGEPPDLQLDTINPDLIVS